MADVTALCERIIIIDHGKLKYDGSINDLSRRVAPFKLIGVALGDPCPCDLSVYGTPVNDGEDTTKQFVRVNANDVAAITARMLADLPIHDLTIEDPPIEDVIERAFQE
jgi:ABC-2 type transport system ATP-binding protein